MTKSALSILFSIIFTLLQTSTYATLTSCKNFFLEKYGLTTTLALHENPRDTTEQTVHKIIQWTKLGSYYFTNITVSGEHWILPAYISLSVGDCENFIDESREPVDYCWKSYLVMNDSDTNKSETFGSLYNYFDSPTLEWDESNPITQDNGGGPFIIGYYGNETIGLSETTLVKSDIFMSKYSVELGLGGGLSFTPESSYLTSLQESKIIKDRVFYFHQDVPATESNYTFNLTVGSIPDNRTNIFWTERSKKNKTWALEGEYAMVTGQEGGECNGTVYFADNGRIRISQNFWGPLINSLPSSQHNREYPCDDKSLDSYPNLTIYTKEIAINIPARMYLDVAKKNSYPDGDFCEYLFDDSHDPNYCAFLGFNVYKDQFIAFSLDKQAIGFDLNETYLVKMITNEIELIVGAVSVVLCLIFAIWGNTYYYEKQSKVIEKEIADSERRQSRAFSLPDSDLGF